MTELFINLRSNPITLLGRIDKHLYQVKVQIVQFFKFQVTLLRNTFSKVHSQNHLEGEVNHTVYLLSVLSSYLFRITNTAFERHRTPKKRPFAV